jgi:hypothetical protein
MDWVVKFTLAGSLTAGLLACTPYGWENRYGPDPIMDGVAVKHASENQLLILRALADDAQITFSSNTDWYQVAQAGFNYVDDECRLYFNGLFFLNRDREQIKAGLTAAGATTAAILGVTGASTASMAIVAQAFGLGASVTDVVAGTYLYQLPPASTLAFVKQLQLAYREGAAARNSSIRTSSWAAYYTIQEYLSLCLPPTIEARIAEHVATARAVPDPTSGGIGITVVSPPPISRAALRASIVSDVNAPLPASLQTPRIPGKNRFGPFEQSMSVSDIKTIQAALCSKVDGDLGDVGSETRRNLRAYLVAIQQDPSDIITDRVGVLVRRLIRDKKTFPPQCPSNGGN